MLKPKFFIPIKALAVLSSLIVTIPVSYGSDLLVCQSQDPKTANLQNEIRNIQKKQFEMKSSSEDKNLFQLMSDYDKKLAKLSIAEGLYNLNLEMRNKIKQTEKKKEQLKKMGDFIDYVETITSKDSIKVMRNMAAMDILLKELEEKTDLNISSADSVEEIVKACQSKTGVLCDALNSSDRNNETKQLLNQFLQAYIIQNNDLIDTEAKADAIKSYRSLLNHKFASNANFEDLYNSALALNQNRPALANLAKVESMKESEQLLQIKRAYCCSYKTQELAEEDNKCKATAITFEHFKCSEYLKDIDKSTKEVIANVTNYQQKTNQLFHFDFNNDAIADLEYEDTKDFAHILQAGFFSTTEKTQTRSINNITEEISHERIAYDQLKGVATNNVLNLYRRGKMNSNGDINAYMERTATSISTEYLGEDDFYNIAAEINASIGNLIEACTGTVCSNNFIGVKKIAAEERGKPVSFVFEILKPDEIDQLLSAKMTSKLKDYFNNTKMELAIAKAKIDAIKNTQAYQHLDQLKQFMIWDFSQRCVASDPETYSTVVTCHDGTKIDHLDYFISSVETILAETDHDAIAANDLSNAGLAQRRVILSNMRGACLGLDRLSQEQSNNAFTSEGITSSCTRIEKMYAEANEPTEAEKNEKVDQKYGYNGDGRYIHKKKPSTWSDIATGAAHALPNAVGTVAMPFFSGIALKNSIPNQEAYWKNVKLNNYAQQWWLNNTPQYPFGMYNPYYYPNYSGHNFNFANQGSLNTATSGFPF